MMNKQDYPHYAFCEGFLYSPSTFNPAEYLRHSYPLCCLPVLQKQKQISLSQMATIMRFLRRSVGEPNGLNPTTQEKQDCTPFWISLSRHLSELSPLLTKTQEERKAVHHHSSPSTQGPGIPTGEVQDLRTGFLSLWFIVEKSGELLVSFWHTGVSGF